MTDFRARVAEGTDRDVGLYFFPAEVGTKYVRLGFSDDGDVVVSFVDRATGQCDVRPVRASTMRQTLREAANFVLRTERGDEPTREIPPR